MAGHGARGLAAAAVVCVLPGCTDLPGPERPQRPETWPPTNATECLRTRPAPDPALAWDAALAVRDRKRLVHDGRVEAVLCVRAVPDVPADAEPVLVSVTGRGGVEVPRGTGIRWWRSTDLVAPVTARATTAGSLDVVLASPETDASGRPEALGTLSVQVVEGPDGLVVTECPDPADCDRG
ncbi:hypothetical protein JQN72_16275 [Phycicoccus sp. CSK15P-2]|uniref:hypothetical protein n=1 Tax=Phycicoccus sp. CSK15P-2 TaxID=2807627 RepID=UPI001951D1E9|nr:hypothetical protein [Phycicoccus sp. CSK15P-2]MBM6405801.1 hypothetical protein [Phycicoccus sp. CSK15P-2]